MDPNMLEICILLACERLASGEWSGTIAALANGIRELSGIEPPNYDHIAEALIELDRQGELEVRKWWDGNRFIFLSREMEIARDQLEKRRAHEFFFTGDFRFRITHKGRKRLAKLPAAEPSKEPIGFRPVQ